MMVTDNNTALACSNRDCKNYDPDSSSYCSKACFEYCESPYSNVY